MADKQPDFIPKRPMHHRRNFTGLTSKEADMERSKWPKETIDLWNRLYKKDAADIETIQKSIVHHVTTTLARAAYNMDNFTAYQAVALSARDRLIAQWNETQGQLSKADPKRVYYLSLEFLLGRSMDNALLNLGLKDVYAKGIGQLGFRMEDVVESESDAALGNGNLGRLAACYMDSLATLEYPAWGYGLRYNYGIFQQRIIEGYQAEFPDYWLNFDNPWELPRLDISIPIYFAGHVHSFQDEYGVTRHKWVPGQSVQAIAYDVPIPGYDTENCNNIRLWRSKPTRVFDLTSFNEGNYEKSVEDATQAEKITSVLYPNDNTMAGKELRLKQQYFWTAASLHDIVRRFKKSQRDWSDFPEQVAIQLNDTHPTLAIVELQRILVDEEQLNWDDAWEIVTRTFAFTNHTVLPEAMEKWSVPMFEYLLPRHLQIVFDINLFFLQKVEKRFPNDRELLKRMSIIEEAQPQQIRMAHLAVVGSHKVNGVAALHSNLIRDTIFKDFVEYYGSDKFVNVTNGITSRRWLNQANHKLSELITETLGSDAWIKDLDLLKGLNKKVDDKVFQKKWMAIKRANKVRLAELIKERCGIEVSPDALFDVQVKRIHEYKRQFMNILAVIHRYRTIKSLTPAQKANVQPRVVIFGGKAAPGYYVAKLVIKLINSVANVVNQDPAVGDLLKVVFIPDYNVSLAEVIVPASDISQHISTAGTEASGTSNMKFVLNGGLILGTMDGANIEILEEIGEDNIFIFGCLAHEVEDLRYAQRYRGVPMDPALQGVLAAIEKGTFEDPKIFQPLISTLTIGKDYYLISADFASYLRANQAVDAAYKDQDEWVKKSIRCTANMGKFSSDRSVKEYADNIWHIKPFKVVDNQQID
ncbi:Non-essential glycogen phosphorylase [Actinomortierella ambigua]|uniref:Alpha-1,4 glucan phosphorylase n=1 Tax=Actinomortierella ambigua TaxID=1343610 RepID=A0A9P6UBK1_9FUNG|nr:Non-essential glycogen phosphorylase [Actinomortierella ambigua]